MNISRYYSQIIFVSFLCHIAAETAIPVNVVAAIAGKSIRISCQSTAEARWYFSAKGKPKDQMVYIDGEVRGRFRGRFRVDTNVSRSFDLIISNVEMNDSGIYNCNESDGMAEAITSTQLTVLDSNPWCHSNINPEGVIGNTGCNMEPDELALSCSVAYQGNSPPELQWVNIGDDATVVESVCESTNSRVTCNLTRMADLSLSGTSFVCQSTTAPAAAQYTFCKSSVVRVLYTVNGSLTPQTVSLSDNVTCSARSSDESCQFRWRWYEGDDVTTESQTKILTAKKLGMHRCEATCSLLGRECKFYAMFVNVTAETSTKSPSVVSLDPPRINFNESLQQSAPAGNSVWMGCLAVAAVICVVVAAAVIIYRRRIVRQAPENGPDEAIRPMV